MDELALWGFAVDAEIGVFSLGAAPRRSSADWRFKVKNLSSTYTAKDVSVHIDGAEAWQLLLSLDGSSWTASADLGDVGANAVTPPIWLRRVTPSTATIGVNTATMRVHADHWAYALT